MKEFNPFLTVIKSSCYLWHELSDMFPISIKERSKICASSFIGFIVVSAIVILTLSL